MISKIRSLTLVFTVFFLLEMLTLSVGESKNLNEDEQLIHVGVGAFKDGLYDIAEKQFSLFLREFPAHAKVQDVSYLLGKAFLSQGKWKEAKAIFSKMVQENKSSDLMDYALFWMAQTEMKLGNPDLSRRWLLSLLKNYPKFEWTDTVYYLLGILDVEAGKLDSAESFLKRVSLLSKQKELIRKASFWLGIVSLKENGFEKATHYLKPIWEDS
ncbi:MAG TPA: tetratricopeptide repeat protein, partial [Thermodesulfobacteriota bacterium]|nr:tetratricopeptide repeat protein [Thermodesulfobacteriota bacterium]